MLKVNDKSDLNQISLTGARAIGMLGLLAQKPHSLNEIKEIFVNYNLLNENQPVDILRIDLNTIQTFGCELVRLNKRCDSKYELVKNPFKLNLTVDDVKLLKRVYAKLKSSSDLILLLDYDDFFRKLANNVQNDEVKEAILGISVLKYYDIPNLKRLISMSLSGDTVKLMYKKPTAKAASEKNIVVQKIDISNNKVYLYGYDLDKRVSAMFHCKNITEIISKKATVNPFYQKSVKVQFKLKLDEKDVLNNDEKIISTKNGSAIIQANYFNEFIALQRILSFGSRCTVTEPENVKNLVIAKLKEMRKRYESGT